MLAAKPAMNRSNRLLHKGNREKESRRLTEQIRKIGNSDTKVCLREIAKLLFQISAVAANDFEVRSKRDVEAGCADDDVDFVLCAGFVDYAVFGHAHCG